MTLIPYIDFDLQTSQETFDLTDERDSKLVAGVEPIVIRRELEDWLARLAQISIGFNSEMSRNTDIVTSESGRGHSSVGLPGERSSGGRI